jgi:segregation and condensation protein A
LERRLTIGSVTTDDFIAAIRSAFMSRPPAVAVDTVVAPFTLTIHDQIDLITGLTAGAQPVTFRGLLQSANNRLEVIVTLLAVLELLKRGRVTVEQSEMFGEIVIAAVPGAYAGENGENGDNGENGE